jgi:membrane-bound ClpP family serine protease
MVFVRGELWHARSHSSIAEGEAVRVVGLDVLRIVVEAYDVSRQSPSFLQNEKQLE